MSDLTDRLRCFDRQTCTEAAERIETLEAELAAMRSGGEPVAAPMVGEMALIAKALQRVGITNVLNHGAASCVFSQGCAGVSQGHLLAYTREIALQCAAALYTDPKPAAQDADRLDWLERAGPTSICLVMDRQHDGEIEVSPDDGPTGYGKTLRAAIDAAIAAQQGDSHE